MTADDVRKWLEQHPTEAAQLVDQVKIARPWGYGHMGHREALAGRFGPKAIGWAVREAWEFYKKPRWYAGVDLPGSEGTRKLGEFDTEEEARAAVDAELVANGWHLAREAA